MSVQQTIPIIQRCFIFLDEPVAHKLHAAGRLDIDTTGLVLMTDDGQWSHRITSPRHHCEKNLSGGAGKIRWKRASPSSLPKACSCIMKKRSHQTCSPRSYHSDRSAPDHQRRPLPPCKNACSRRWVTTSWDYIASVSATLPSMRRWSPANTAR